MSNKGRKLIKCDCPACVGGFNSTNTKGLNPNCLVCKGRGWIRRMKGLQEDNVNENKPATINELKENE